MKRYEFTDTHDNSVRLNASSSGEDRVWLFIDSKKYENNEFKSVTSGAYLTIKEARLLIASLEAMVEGLERKR